MLALISFIVVLFDLATNKKYRVWFWSIVGTIAIFLTVTYQINYAYSTLNKIIYGPHGRLSQYMNK